MARESALNLNDGMYYGTLCKSSAHPLRSVSRQPCVGKKEEGSENASSRRLKLKSPTDPILSDRPRTDSSSLDCAITTLLSPLIFPDAACQRELELELHQPNPKSPSPSFDLRWAASPASATFDGRLLCQRRCELCELCEPAALAQAASPRLLPEVPRLSCLAKFRLASPRRPWGLRKLQLPLGSLMTTMQRAPPSSLSFVAGD